MHVVIAPDSFKGSISAGAAATAIADGWRSVRPHDELSTVPLADGGEGTLDVLAAAHEGAIWQRRNPAIASDTGHDQVHESAFVDLIVALQHLQSQRRAREGEEYIQTDAIARASRSDAELPAGDKRAGP